MIKKAKTLKTIQWVNVIMFGAMVVVNALANMLPLNGITTGAVSNAYPNLFAPAAITFAVWGVIYLLLLAFTVYQTGILGKNSRDSLAAVRRIGPLFALSSLFNIVWIFCWHYSQILLSLVCMVGLLVTLILIFRNIMREPLSPAEKLFVKLPFSVYFGWITVATIANVTVALVSIEWNALGISAAYWTVIMLMAGLLIGLFVLYFKNAVAFGATMIWAYMGIIIKHTSDASFAWDYPIVVWAAAFAAIVLFAACVLVTLKPRVSTKAKQLVHVNAAYQVSE